MEPFLAVAFPEKMAKRASCPKCGNILRLIWTTANKDDQDRLSFECSACKNDVDILIVRDPV
jgi:transcription initiation factor IIE alpha subunit